MRKDIELGDKVKDVLTGFSGVAIARTEWLNGCVRITIQGEGMKDGLPIEGFTVDEQQIKVMKAKAFVPETATAPAPKTKKPGGPYKATPRTGGR